MTTGFDTVIFDFDGTLVDGLDAIHHCFVLTHEELNIPVPSKEEVTAWIGYPLKEICLSLAGKEHGHKIEDIIRLYREHARRILPTESKLKPGVEEMLRFLKDKGIKLGIATTKKTASTVLTLETIGIEKYFGFVSGVDLVSRPKPDAEQLELVMKKLGSEPEKTFMVGDTHLDVLAAKNAGCRSLALLDGYGDHDKIEAARPDFTVTGSAELKSFWSGIL